MQQYYSRPVSAGRPGRGLTVFLIVLVVLLAAVAALSWLALSDPNAGKGLDAVAPSDAVVKELFQSAATGKESTFSTEQTNGLLAYLLQKYNKTESTSSVRIRALAVADAEGDRADLYLPVQYKGKNLGITLNVTPSTSADGSELVFRVNSARVGRLPVPAGPLLKAAEKKLPAGFTLDGTEISCPAPSVTLSVLNVSGSLKISALRMEDGLLRIGAKMAVTIAD